MSLVQLPGELKLVLASAIGFLVTEGLKALGNLFHVDLSGNAAAVTAALVTAIVFFADLLLAKIPPEFEGVANSILLLLVAVLSAYGLHRTAKRLG